MFVSHSEYWISLMWSTLNNFCVSSLMTCFLSSLNFLLLWRSGRTWGFIVRRWHRMLGSIPGMSEVIHAKVSRCRAITSTIWSYAAWPRDLPSLEILPPISLSGMSPAASSCLSRAISARATPYSLGAWVVTVNTPLFVLRLFL